MNVRIQPRRGRCFLCDPRVVVSVESLTGKIHGIWKPNVSSQKNTGSTGSDRTTPSELSALNQGKSLDLATLLDCWTVGGWVIQQTRAERQSPHRNTCSQNR